MFGKQQWSGFAMGNNLAPTVAIIYVNELDSRILEKSDGCMTLKRFCSVITFDHNNAIKFTL